MKYLVWTFLVSSLFAQDILRPTADSNSNPTIGCAGTAQTSSSMAKAYDPQGLSTYASLPASGNDNGGVKEGRVFSNWRTSGNSYSALTLKVNAQIDTEQGKGCIAYSINGGGTYTTIECSAVSVGRTTYSVSLAAGQDLNQLRIAACASGNKGYSRQGVDPGTGSVYIWDIWTEGSTTGAAAGEGSGAGQPHRGIISVN